MSNQHVVDFKNSILFVFFSDGYLLLLKRSGDAGIEGFIEQIFNGEFGRGNVVSDELYRHEWRY